MDKYLLINLYVSASNIFCLNFDTAQNSVWFEIKHKLADKKIQTISKFV